MRNTPYMAFVLTAAALAADAELSAEPCVLTAQGSSDFSITLAVDASPPEQTAARELAEYLNQVTAVQFKLIAPSAAAGRPVIAVGPGAAKLVAPDLDLAKAGSTGLGEDGIVLKTAGRNLILTGAEGSKRGTLYAVYEFLERAAGVHWWTHTEECVPRQPNLTIEPLDVRYRPPFLYREVFGWGMVPQERHWGYDDSDAAVKDWALARFAARLRNNGHGTALPASLGGCIMPLGWCHTFYPFLPPEKYFRERPEWYSEINGRRTAEQAQLCMTNDSMLAELAKNVLAKVREQPHLGMVVVTQNDWLGNCQCARCKALDDGEGSPMGSLLYGVNKVAEAVEKEFPDVLVATHAYQYARKPPRTIRPRDNVVIWFCVIERSAPQPIASEINRSMLEDLRGWAQAAPRLFLWDYTMNLPGPLAPHPNWQVFGPDLRTYRENHVIGCFLESESAAVTPFVELKVYLMARQLWDPARDEAATVDEFLRGYYGAAAPALRDVLRLLAERAQPTRLTWHQGPDASWLDLPAMNQATELFRQAEVAVAQEAAARARVQRARWAIDHQWLYGYGLYRAVAKRADLPFLGPTDPAAASADFAARVRAEIAKWPGYFLTGALTLHMGQSFDAYLDQLAARAATALKTGPLPSLFQDIPRERIIDMDESLASVFTTAGATIVNDAKAANGLAMRVPKAPAPSWAVQAKTTDFGALGGFGKYRVYAVARCEVAAEAGAAFVGGVWDGKRGNLGTVSFPIGKPAPAAAGAGRLSDPFASGTPVGDGEYHVFDFGVYDLPHSDLSVWVGTTTGDLYVDRFLFVRDTNR